MHHHEPHGVDRESRREDAWPERFLREERLRPEEAAGIERVLRAAARERHRRPDGRPRRWTRWSRWLPAACVAAVVLVAAVVRLVPTAPLEREDDAGPRTMTLKIVRTDVPDAEPYHLVIEFERRAGLEPRRPTNQRGVP